MTSNCNTTTGIRFGYISGNSLDPATVEILMYGDQAKDVSYANAYAEAKAEAETSWASIVEEAGIAASEVDAGMNDKDRESFIAKWIEEHHTGCADMEEFVDIELQAFSDQSQIDEPYIEGDFEGVKYGTSWLGGALNFFIFEGPVGYVERLCSPCVPNAGDLDSGFLLRDEFNDEQHGTDNECYVVPRDWLTKDEVPA